MQIYIFYHLKAVQHPSLSYQHYPLLDSLVHHIMLVVLCFSSLGLKLAQNARLELE